MMKRNILALAFLVAGLWYGCAEKPVEPTPEALGLNYYPLEVGNYRIYDVTNIRIQNNVGDTTRFQVRERVDTAYVDQANVTTYKIIRSVRPGEGSTWADDSVMLVTKSNNSIVEMKNNTRRIKLVFPVKNGKIWNADAFNSNEVNYEEDRKEKFKLTNVGEPVTIGGKTYDESLTVIQGRPTDNLINLDDRKEVYVKDIGLVYRIFNKVTYCNDSQSITCPFDPENKFKLNGHERIEVLRSHGKM
ncbi:hypothetical protein [Botryobacter ruber]|uniref:hypothetical protein n=1 Tax=Botryobacter ruber TaxID=2171629 RepID=UPI000F65558E|nr:hypothetical protein [Botryobacter ruber]